jgi:hypothetical protein
MSTVLEPRHVHPLRWRQAIDVARETCGRFFVEGRSPADALRSFGLASSDAPSWAHAVNVIAELYHTPAEVLTAEASAA